MKLRTKKLRDRRASNGDALDTPPPPELASILEQYRGQSDALISVLGEIQNQYGYLPPQPLKYAARELGHPLSRVYGAATFYSMFNIQPRSGGTVRVCDGPSCWLNGASEVHTAAKEALGEAQVVERSSCLGLCDHAPAALINMQQGGPFTPDNIKDILANLQSYIKKYTQPLPGEKRVLLAHAGDIDPTNIDSALAHGAYQGLQAALNRSPQDIIAEIVAANLRGRGGAGFPAGVKWRIVAEAAGAEKYIVCNADESEPLVFKDRVLIDNNPHLILEGMAIAAYATGAQTGYIYIRGEYEAQAVLLAQAIQQAEAHGWLGEGIGGSDFSFHVHVHRGAGAYICGEETALLESLEGYRGEPRLRPPYPPTSGYKNAPTAVNNVETFANVPGILVHGADWYNALSDGESAGTKLYTLLGHVNNPGLFEAPFGLTLRQIIAEFGGGMLPGSTLNCALTGGAAGTIIPPDFLDVPIDYASVKQGVSLGAGAFLVCDESISPVALLRELLHFFENESCGKCTPCRIGTRRARQILDRLQDGKGHPGDVQMLTTLAHTLRSASFCGLGQGAAIPMISALSHFADRFSAAEKSN